MSLIKIVRYNENNQFDGIFNFITKYTKEDDLHSSNHVHIFVSSNGTAGGYQRDLRVPIGYENKERIYYWISEDIENSWYAIDLRGFKLRLDSYVYKASERDFFKRWEILGSNDNIEWTSLCQHENPFNDPQTNLYTFHGICNENRNMFSIFKIKVYENRYYDRCQFAIYGLEFYGELYSKYDVLTNCAKHVFISKNLLFVGVYLFSVLV